MKKRAVLETFCPSSFLGISKTKSTALYVTGTPRLMYLITWTVVHNLMASFSHRTTPFCFFVLLQYARRGKIHLDQKNTKRIKIRFEKCVKKEPSRRGLFNSIVVYLLGSNVYSNVHLILLRLNQTYKSPHWLSYRNHNINDH